MSFLKSKRNRIIFFVGIGLFVLATVAAILVASLTRVPPPRTLFNYGDFDYVEVDDGVEIVAYNGNNPVVVIPTAIDGRFVTSIGDGAFYGTTVTEVIVGDFTTRIGRGAFYNCTALKKIDLGDSLVSIGDSAFYNCMALCEIVFPETLTTLGESVFYNISIESVTLPSGITSLPPYAFSYCVELTSFDAKGVITDIGEGAFYCCELLESVDLDGVRSVGPLAFLSCVKLTEVNIPAMLTDIGVDAFGDCDALTAFNVHPDNERYASPLGALVDLSNGLLISYPQSAPATEITLPDYITVIGNRAFADCKNLTTVILPDGLSAIGAYAFHNAASLGGIKLQNTEQGTSFELPAGITSIGGCAFEETPVYKAINTEMLIVGDGILLKYTAPRDITGAITESEYTKIVREQGVQNGVTVSMKKYVVTVPDGVKSIVSSLVTVTFRPSSFPPAWSISATMPL